MEFENLFKVLNSLHLTTDEFKEVVTKEMTPVSYPKSYLLSEAPRVAEYAYFIQTGFAMSFFYIEGKKHVNNFWKQDQIMCLAQSFVDQVPSKEHIQLMEDSDLLCLSHSSLIKLFNNFSESHILYRIVINQYFQHSQERILDMQRLSASARFEKLLHIFPEIEQIIPQEYLASYLGITPQSLSRIKRKK